jgi:glycosyltransferase involved in cell wall biosynthesis
LNKVSLVITCHNQHRYLKQLADMLMKYNEQLARTELIVVDSSDEVVTLPTNFQVYRVPNNGPSAARNFGVSKATGEWVLFCDADDLIHPYAISLLDKLVEPSTDAVFFTFKRVYNETIVATAEKHFASFQYPADPELDRIIDPVFFLKNFFPVHAVIIKRSVFEKIQFNEEQWFIEDVRLYLELALIPGIEIRYCKAENFASFHRDFKERTSLSSSNKAAYWRSICENYNYFMTHSNPSLANKAELIKLVVINFHVVSAAVKPILASENKEIWNLFFGIPRLFRIPFFYRLLELLNEVKRFVARKS